MGTDYVAAQQNRSLPANVVNRLLLDARDDQWRPSAIDGRPGTVRVVLSARSEWTCSDVAGNGATGALPFGSEVSMSNVTVPSYTFATDVNSTADSIECVHQLQAPAGAALHDVRVVISTPVRTRFVTFFSSQYFIVL